MLAFGYISEMGFGITRNQHRKAQAARATSPLAEHGPRSLQSQQVVACAKAKCMHVESVPRTARGATLSSTALLGRTKKKVRKQIRRKQILRSSKVAKAVFLVYMQPTNHSRTNDQTKHPIPRRAKARSRGRRTTLDARASLSGLWLRKREAKTESAAARAFAPSFGTPVPAIDGRGTPAAAAVFARPSRIGNANRLSTTALLELVPQLLSLLAGTPVPARPSPVRHHAPAGAPETCSGSRRTSGGPLCNLAYTEIGALLGHRRDESLSEVVPLFGGQARDQVLLGEEEPGLSARRFD